MGNNTLLHIYNGTLLRPKKKMPFAAIWMDLEISILKQSKSERERQIPYDITYVWNIKYDTNELNYETEINSQL